MDRFKHVVLDLVAISTGALVVLAAQLESNGFDGVNWASVAAAGIGGLIAWSRTATGGLRAEPTIGA